MKWYNKSKTKMIDISKVSYFEYIPRQSNTLDDILKLSVEGHVVEIRNDSANEVYKILTSTKEII